LLDDHDPNRRILSSWKVLDCGNGRYPSRRRHQQRFGMRCVGRDRASLHAAEVYLEVLENPLDIVQFTVV
jgi:hypothetical protein